ncbi:zinc iron transporter protein [Rutstroemia sp. NJR-2017a WRK4]|nr:zinc iron transporter protein [Rutstroemia sp. NJR-2017a WRK4]
MLFSNITARDAFLALLVFAVRGGGQVVLTGCHVNNGQEVCLLPGGAETTIAQTVAATPTSPNENSAQTTEESGSGQTTAVTDCHPHETQYYCVNGDGVDVEVLAISTGSEPLPTAYDDCHAHSEEDLWCVAPDGTEVQVLPSGEDADEAEGSCHFHAGVEHCPGQENSCERRDRDYNVSLRIGLLFVVLVTSGIAVYAPILMRKLLNVDPTGTVFTVVKQFGTGIIISTAFVHLLTHAELMWGNECLGGLTYEATTTAIAMAGAFIAFLIDFLGHRLALWRRFKVQSQAPNPSYSSANEETDPTIKETNTHPSTAAAPALASLSHHHDALGSTHPNDALSVLILEAGIIFHSLLLGITLVVAGDSVFTTLFIVIVFHQVFEGLALGARIAAITADNISKTKYFTLPLAFAFVTPTGMALGIGILNQFNGNDPSTIIALGTLDSLSAGILAWVGFVSMWAQDWMHGELRNASLLKTSLGGISLVAGILLMGLLGKWA